VRKIFGPKKSEIYKEYEHKEELRDLHSSATSADRSNQGHYDVSRIRQTNATKMI
jgi:hypothetical protein